MNTILISIIAPIIGKYYFDQTPYQCFLIFAFFFLIAIGFNMFFRITDRDKAIHDFVVKKGGYMDIMPFEPDKKKSTYFEVGKVQNKDVYFIIATKNGISKKVTIPYKETRIKYVDCKEKAKVEFVQTRHILFNHPGRSIIPYIVHEMEFKMNIPEIEKKSKVK